MRKGNNPERKEPYGVKLTFEVPNRIRKPFEGEISGNFCLIIEREVIIQVEPRGEATFDVFIESFETREEAEDFGNFFIDSLFWGALSDPSVLLEEQWVPWIWKESYSFEKHERPDLPHKDFPHYSEGPLLVYDLRHEEVEHVKRPPTGEIGTATPLKGQVFFISVTEFLDNKEEIDGRVRTALEIYSSASHEKTERAQFVSTISSLEPLIEREKYSNLDEYSEVSEAVEETLNDLISVINDAKSKYGLSEPLQDSWRNRLKNELRGESIGQALERMVREQIPEVEGAPSVIREAYNLRSTILHEGGYIDENDHETVMEAQRLVPLIISSFIHKEAYQEAVRRRVGRDLPTI